MVKICIDAGHYAKANRSPAVKAYYESEVMWKLSNLQKKFLEEYDGVQVIMSRDKQGVDKELTQRGKMSKGCDLFISNHSDAVGSRVDDKVDFVSIYHLTEDTDTNIDEKSKEIAKVLAPVIAKTIGTKQGYKLCTKKSGNDRDGDGKKDDDWFGVCFGAKSVGTPGMLIEHSFHTNTRITNWLLDDKNLEKLAKAEADALAKYFGLKKKGSSKPKPEAGQMYRVRKSWKDFASQVGAYSVLENAKKSCPVGYSVYDKDGKEVYSNKPVQKPSNKVDHAASMNSAFVGTYKVNAVGGLHLRTGASTSKASIEVMPNGSKVKCYGYHTGNWLFVVAASGKTGFALKDYLVKAK